MKMECFGINSILNSHVDLAFFLEVQGPSYHYGV